MIDSALIHIDEMDSSLDEMVEQVIQMAMTPKLENPLDVENENSSNATKCESNNTNKIEIDDEAITYKCTHSQNHTVSSDCNNSLGKDRNKINPSTSISPPNASSLRQEEPNAMTSHQMSPNACDRNRVTFDSLSTVSTGWTGSDSSIQNDFDENGSTNVSLPSRGSVSVMSRPVIVRNHPKLPQIAELTERIANHVKHQKWMLAEKLVLKCPEIILNQIQSLQNRTILHLLLSQPLSVKVPSSLVSKIVHLKPEVLGIRDNQKNLPLHHAVKTMKGIKIITLLVHCYKASTGVKNAKGDLPLHYAVQSANTSHADMESSGVLLLTKVFPKGVLANNNEGKTPLHYACMGSKNIQPPRSKISPYIVSHLLLLHSQFKQRPSTRDLLGNSPLHTAIKENAPIEVIEAFANPDLKFNYSKLFLQRDKFGDLPLHLVLRKLSSNPNLSYDCYHKMIAFMIKTAPTAGSQLSSTGILPLHIATKYDFPSPFIKALLVLDMPITIRAQNKSSRKTSDFTSLAASYVEDVDQHPNNNSWFHIAVDCQDKYIHIMEQILSNSLSHQEIIILARHLGGKDGKTHLIDAASEQCRNLFRRYLKLHNRYEFISLGLKSRNTKDVKEYQALDHGISSEDLVSDKVCSSDKYSNDEPPDQSSGLCEDSEVYMTNNGVEVCSLRNQSLYDVILRFFLYEEQFLAEITVREQYNLSSSFVEDIYRYHPEKNYVEKSLLYIVYEKPEHTLNCVFNKTAAGTKSEKWMDKCCIVLGQIASAIRHLHAKGAVHGYLDPENVAKYGNIWKITNVGKVTPIGERMRGPLR